MSDAPFGRSPFESQVAGLLGEAVSGAAPPPGLAAAIRSRIEAPDAVAALATVDAFVPPAGLRQRVAAAIAAALVVPPASRLRLVTQHPLVVAALGVAAAAALTAAGRVRDHHRGVLGARRHCARGGRRRGRRRWARCRRR